MTKSTYTNEDNRQATLQTEMPAFQEADQVLHLKRLLVTLKQHYEKSLQQMQIQLQAEQSQRMTIEKELAKVQQDFVENQKHHEDELEALRQQQNALKEMLKKAQEELARREALPSTEQNSEETKNQRVKQLEQVLPYLREQTSEAHLETEQLREELNEAQKKVKILEQDLLTNKQKSQKEIEHLQHLLEEQKLHEPDLETVVSTTSSHYLRRELDSIKRTLQQGAEESRALESRYVDMLNEKIGLEHQCKQLQTQLEHQSSNLSSFQEKLHDLEDRKKSLEAAMQIKEEKWNATIHEFQELQKRNSYLNELIREKEAIQDKYEQLKEEWKLMSERLDEALEARKQTDEHIIHLETIATHQEAQLQEITLQLQTTFQEREAFENEKNQFQILLEESENRLKMAQQHLAKKVKEAALLNEKLELELGNAAQLMETIEFQKSQLTQLQASVELYQKQEKKLQEQLHESLKGTENQILKWEEKYFRMYDKWQESENKIKELKKFEEKHAQMQSLFSNLGTFMSGSFNPANSLFHLNSETPERPLTRPFGFDPSEEISIEANHTDPLEDKYDLFGMRQPPDKYNPNLFS